MLSYRAGVDLVVEIIAAAFMNEGIGETVDISHQELVESMEAGNPNPNINILVTIIR